MQVRKRNLVLAVVRSMAGQDQFPSTLATALSQRIDTWILPMYGYTEEEELATLSPNALRGALVVLLRREGGSGGCLGGFCFFSLHSFSGLGSARKLREFWCLAPHDPSATKGAFGWGLKGCLAGVPIFEVWNFGLGMCLPLFLMVLSAAAQSVWLAGAWMQRWQARQCSQHAHGSASPLLPAHPAALPPCFHLPCTNDVSFLCTCVCRGARSRHQHWRPAGHC